MNRAGVAAGRPVERGGEAGKNSRAPSSHGGLELSAVLTHGGPLGFEFQTKVHKNKFLFIFVLSVLLVMVDQDPYWSWWALGFSQVRFIDITDLPKLVYKCIKHRVLYLSL